MSDRITIASRAVVLSLYGWTISGPVGHELAVKHVNGTTAQLYAANDADLIAKVAVYENWANDLGLPIIR